MTWGSLLTTGWTVSQLGCPLCFLHCQARSQCPTLPPGLCLCSSATSAKREFLFPNSWNPRPGICFGRIHFGQCLLLGHPLPWVQYPGIAPGCLGWCWLTWTPWTVSSKGVVPRRQPEGMAAGRYNHKGPLPPLFTGEGDMAAFFRVRSKASHASFHLQNPLVWGQHAEGSKWQEIEKEPGHLCYQWRATNKVVEPCNCKMK